MEALKGFNACGFPRFKGNHETKTEGMEVPREKDRVKRQRVKGNQNKVPVLYGIKWRSDAAAQVPTSDFAPGFVP